MVSPWGIKNLGTKKKTASRDFYFLETALSCSTVISRYIFHLLLSFFSDSIWDILTYSLPSFFQLLQFLDPASVQWLRELAYLDGWIHHDHQKNWQQAHTHRHFSTLWFRSEHYGKPFVFVWLFVWSFVCLLVVVLVLRYLFVCVSVKRPKIKAWLLTSWILWCNCSNENSLE